VLVWSGRGFQTKRQLPGFSIIVFSVAYDPTGRFLAFSGDQQPQRPGESLVKVWDLESDREAYSVEPFDGDQIMFSVAFSGNGKWLVGGGSDKAIRVWDAATGRQLSGIVQGMLVMTGRVTLLGLSRWAGTGGSYRTIQRFFATVIPWATLFWVFFRQHVSRPGEVSLVAGDAVVATKAGKHTHGRDRFFSSLYGKPVPGLAFFALSLVSVQQRRSFPMRVEQVVRSDAEKAASKAKAAAKKSTASGTKRRLGRPKGSTNHPKTPSTLTPELGRIKTMLAASLPLMTTMLSVTYLVLDGHFGTHNALPMARQCGLHLIRVVPQ
jgi:hypothetical protein